MNLKEAMQALCAQAVDIAERQYGKTTDEIVGFLTDNGETIDPSLYNWSTAFINAALNAVGITGTTGSNFPASFVDWGDLVFDNEEPLRGDIIIMGRGYSTGMLGQCGLFTGEIRQHPTIGAQYRVINAWVTAGRVQYDWLNAFSVTVVRPFVPADLLFPDATDAFIPDSIIPQVSPLRVIKPMRQRVMLIPRPKATQSNIAPYNPSNSSQQKLLTGLAQGETGGRSNASMLGVGGKDLAGSPINKNGFPQWSGTGNSHAAGTYQFQPATWDAMANKYNLNFQNTSDQAAGAWYLAQEVYARKNPGDTLQSALDRGDNQKVQDSLDRTWTSAGGNSALPGGLAKNLDVGVVNKPLLDSQGQPSKPNDGEGGGGSPADSVSSNPQPAATPSGKKMPDCKQVNGKWTYGAATVDTIVSRMPTHEPWRPHPDSKVPAPPLEDLEPLNPGNGGVTANPTPTDGKQNCSFNLPNTSDISNDSYYAIAAAADQIALSFATCLAIADLESGFQSNANKDSIGGMFSFSDTTWQDMVKQYGNKFNITTDPNMKFDPSANALIGAQAIANHQTALMGMGVDPTVGNLYIMGMMGTQDGLRFIQAAMDTPDADASLMFPKIAAAQPNTFSGASVGQVYNQLKLKGDAKGDAYDNQHGLPAPCDRGNAPTDTRSA